MIQLAFLNYKATRITNRLLCLETQDRPTHVKTRACLTLIYPCHHNKASWIAGNPAEIEKQNLIKFSLCCRMKPLLEDAAAWIIACLELNCGHRQAAVLRITMNRFPYPLWVKVTQRDDISHGTVSRGFSAGFSQCWMKAAGCVTADVGQHPITPPALTPAGLFLTAEPREDRHQPVPLSLGMKSVQTWLAVWTGLGLRLEGHTLNLKIRQEQATYKVALWWRLLGDVDGQRDCYKSQIRLTATGSQAYLPVAMIHQASMQPSMIETDRLRCSVSKIKTLICP